MSLKKPWLGLYIIVGKIIGNDIGPTNHVLSSQISRDAGKQ
jgi:hypothetical protein